MDTEREARIQAEARIRELEEPATPTARRMIAPVLRRPYPPVLAGGEQRLEPIAALADGVAAALVAVQQRQHQTHLAAGFLRRVDGVEQRPAGGAGVVHDGDG